MPISARWLAAAILILGCTRSPRATPSLSPADSLPATAAGTALAGWLSNYNSANP